MGDYGVGNSEKTGQNEALEANAPPSRSANQVDEAPIPASHHEEPRQEGVVRNEELAAGSRGAQPRSSRPDRDQAPPDDEADAD
jgi:hypothetical protein